MLVDEIPITNQNLMQVLGPFLEQLGREVGMIMLRLDRLELMMEEATGVKLIGLGVEETEE